jgi:hypothetical protein
MDNDRESDRDECHQILYVSGRAFSCAVFSNRVKIPSYQNISAPARREFLGSSV